MKSTYLALAVLLFITQSCKTPEEKVLSAQEITDMAIETMGGTTIANSKIEFDFRNRHYTSTREGGAFQYERIFSDSLNRVRDVLNNEGFERYVNDTLSTLTPDTMKVKYANSVNSVIYFAMLPYGLNDPAVKKERLPSTTLHGNVYDKVRITFEKEGGGEDYEDVFVFWIAQKTRAVDYFGYNYATDGGGARFRMAYNRRAVNGIVFADYINYKPKQKRLDVEAFDVAFLDDELEELSRIELENVVVSIND